MKHCIINQCLFWKDLVGIILNCVDEDEAQRSMTKMHKGACGGHNYWRDTTYKILRDGYYWPILFLDAFSKVRLVWSVKCFAGKKNLLPLPLNTIAMDGPFQ